MNDPNREKQRGQAALASSRDVGIECLHWGSSLCENSKELDLGELFLQFYASAPGFSRSAGYCETKKCDKSGPVSVFTQARSNFHIQVLNERQHLSAKADYAHSSGECQTQTLVKDISTRLLARNSLTAEPTPNCRHGLCEQQGCRWALHNRTWTRLYPELPSRCPQRSSKSPQSGHTGGSRECDP